MDAGRDRRPRILVFADQFTPSLNGGGPVTSIVNLVNALGDEFAFHVATLDRDLGATTPYAGVVVNQWLERGACKVLHRPASRLWHIANPADPQAIGPDLIYLNSLFSTATTLPFLAWRQISRKAAPPVILAPRGALAAAALRIKGWKKRPVLSLAGSLGAFDALHWQATSEEEAAVIALQIAPSSSRLHRAANIPAAVAPLPPAPKAPDHPLRIAFLGRLVPMKNLDYALEILAKINGAVQFDIYGPSEDRTFETQCRRLAEGLPPTIALSWKGPVAPHDVRPLLARYDLLFSPTRGENYGHVIAESLSVGTPVLISDQTPWRHLERHGVGFDLPLAEPLAFARAIEQLAGESEALAMARRQRVLAYWQAHSAQDAAIAAHRTMFNAVLGRQSHSPFR